MFFPSVQYYLPFFLSVIIPLSVSYKMINIVDHKQCPRLSERTHQLETESSSGLILTLGSLKDRSWHREENFMCSFKVKPLFDNMGIFIVIQNIIFRKNSTGCIDYVQYKRGDGSTSKRYCGSLTASLGMDRIFAPDAYATELAPTVNSFISRFGEVEVNIYISKEPLKAYEEMELEIVFTMFSHCNLNDQYHCSQEYREYCIYRDFINDGYVNCPFPDCVDENGCSQHILEAHSSIGDKVVIGSVTSLFIIFVFFVCSIWLCRKYKKLCWDENFATASNTNQTTTVEENLENFHNISMPSTTRDTASHSINADEDKDLPPSYDTLFPNR